MTDVRDDALDELRESMTGRVIGATDPDYDDARTVFNAMIDRRPAVIARCAGTSDVQRAVDFARRHDLEIAVRGGGHSVAGMAVNDGGLVVDLRDLNSVEVDADSRTAVVAGGATMSHLDRACQPFGLATTGGRVSTTGVGGFVLGGGTGWLDRKFGLACDSLVAAELVTADGTVVRASEVENPDLFWALHGGGGNFGIAVSLTLRLHPLPVSTLGFLAWSPDRGPEIARIFRDVIENGPDELGGGVLYATGPEDDPAVPEHLAGRLMLAIAVIYAGTEAEARQAIAPLLAAEPEGLSIGEMPYADLQSALDDPPGLRNYWSAEHLSALPDEAIDAFCARADTLLVPSASQHVLFAAGGAAARGRSEYPLPWRHAPWVVHPFALWTDPADDLRSIQWTHDVRADLHPWATGDIYLNFIGNEGEERVVAGLGQDNYDRLAAIKGEYDPGNVFHLNHNIVPLTPSRA